MVVGMKQEVLITYRDSWLGDPGTRTCPNKQEAGGFLSTTDRDFPRVAKDMKLLVIDI